jgi:hypothetical protein
MSKLTGEEMSEPANAGKQNPPKKSWLTVDEWAVALALVVAALVKLGWLHGLQW